MPWVRFDDQFPINRKVDGLSDAAFRLHVSAIFWCARNLTDGLVPEEDLGIVCARVRTPERFATELVRRNLWIVVDGGWEINDYLEFQPSKQKVNEERRKNAERQTRYRERHGNASSNGVSNGVSNAPPVPARPVGTTKSSLSPTATPAEDRDEDSDLDQTIVDLLVEETGITLTPDQAAVIRRRVVGSRAIKNRAAYIAKAIRADPTGFLPAGRDPASRPVREVLAVGGECDHGAPAGVGCALCRRAARSEAS